MTFYSSAHDDNGIYFGGIYNNHHVQRLNNITKKSTRETTMFDEENVKLVTNNVKMSKASNWYVLSLYLLGVYYKISSVKEWQSDKLNMVAWMQEN